MSGSPIFMIDDNCVKGETAISLFLSDLVN